MRELSIVLVVALNLFIAIRYCWLIWRQKIKPSLAMWIFFTIAVGGSLITYLLEGEYSLLDNILGSTDVVLVVSVSVAIALFGDKSCKFSRFDRGCLLAVLAIVVFWALTQHHLAANLSIQAIMVIAYFPVVKRLWRADRNTESFGAWISMLLVTAISLFSSKGLLATVYALRALLSILALLALMVRVELRQRAAGQAHASASNASLMINSPPEMCRDTN